ncbi:MAG: hypothetical protein ACT4PJ_05110 [Gemmatimonadaceae bacterium]
MISIVMLLATMALVSGVVVLVMDRRRDGDPRRVQRLEERVARLEGSVESMASEMERLSEGQRFMTKLLSDRVSGPGRGHGSEPAP